MDKDAFVLALKMPVVFGTETITELQIRRPKGKDLRGMGADKGMDDMLALLSKCSGQPPKLIDSLDCSDVFAACEVLGNFMQNGRETGEAQ